MLKIFLWRNNCLKRFKKRLATRRSKTFQEHIAKYDLSPDAINSAFVWDDVYFWGKLSKKWKRALERREKWNQIKSRILKFSK